MITLTIQKWVFWFFIGLSAVQIIVAFLLMYYRIKIVNSKREIAKLLGGQP